MSSAQTAKQSPGRKHQKRSANDFQAVFADTYSSRWSELYSALARPTEHVALQNSFASGQDLENDDWQTAISMGPIKAM